MITRLILIGIIGFVMMGYVPRWLSAGDHAWIVWATAAGIVLGGPWWMRRAFRSAKRPS